MHCLIHAVIVVGLSVGEVRFLLYLVELQEGKLLMQCQTNKHPGSVTQKGCFGIR